MADPNGAERAPVGVLDLGDIAYERAPIRVTLHGTRRSFDGWVRGPGCPGDVMAQFARLYRAYGLSDDATDAASVEFLTGAFKVLLEEDGKPVDFKTANDLAGDIGRGFLVLNHLRWTEPVTAEDDADPEAPGGGDASTTATSSPTSSAATAASAPTAAAG